MKQDEVNHEAWIIRDGTIKLTEAGRDNVPSIDAITIQTRGFWPQGGGPIIFIEDEQGGADIARLIAAAPETAQERDRLKALNVGLVEILQAIVKCEDEGDTELYDLDMGERPGPSPWQSSQLGKAMADARAALAKARP